LEIRRTLAKTNPDAYLSEIAMALNNLGSLYYSNNAHTKAQNARFVLLCVRCCYSKAQQDC
jgi:hypothetical protein